MTSSFKIFVLFFVCILCSRAQTSLAETSKHSVLLEEIDKGPLSQGLIQYRLQASDKDAKFANDTHVNRLLSTALNFEIARNLDNVSVIAKPFGFEIQYTTLSSEFVKSTKRVLDRTEELLRSGQLDTYLDTARSNLRQMLNTTREEVQAKGSNGETNIRGMNDENHFYRTKRPAVLKRFRQKKKQLSNESVVRLFGRCLNRENDALRLTSILKNLKRQAPSPSVDPDEKPNTSLLVPLEKASVTAIDDTIGGNQLLLRFIQSISSEYTKSERTGAMLAQFAVRELQFGTLARDLLAEGASIVPSQNESLSVKSWYELTVRCPKNKVGKVVTLVRNQWQRWVRMGMPEPDSRAGFALARTRIAIAATIPHLHLSLKANQGSFLEDLTNLGQGDDFVAKSSKWIEQISDRLRTDIDSSRLNLEVRGDINGYTLTQLSSAYPEARLIVIRPD